MDRREFVKGSLMGGVGVALESTKESKGKGGGKTKGTRSWKVSNKHVEIELSEDRRGGLASFVDLESKRNFVVPTPRPLYELLLFEKGKELVELSSLDAESFDVERSSAAGKEALTLSYGRLGAYDLRVTCTVVLDADSSLSKWRISIQNNTSYGVRAIRFPVVVSPAALGESDEDDYYISGSWGSRMPGRGRLPRKRAEFRADGGRGSSWMPDHYPGNVAVQFQAYYDQIAGLYMATYDDAGNVKSYRLTPLADGLDLTIEHNYDERAGLSFELPYDTILGVFHGDWYAAADIYKEWAHQQHWCAKKVVERTGLPDWLKEPRPWLLIGCQATPYRFGGAVGNLPAEYPSELYWPAKKVVPLVRDYSSIFQTPVVVFMEGWEGIGAPGGPVGIFPPREGEESYKAAMADLTRDDNYPCMYLAGLHWCFKRPAVGFYDWESFEREGRLMAALDDHGELIISDMNKRTYIGGQKAFVSLCTGSQEMQDLWVRNFLHLMDLGAVALQLDQQLGFHAQLCYSEQHSHPPGYGSWMYKRTLEFIRRVRSEARKRNPAAILTVETPCELWIQELDACFNREYKVGGIPLFDYIYHEYAVSFGGDNMMGVWHPEAALMKHATILVLGMQNTVSIGEEEYKFKVNPDYPILTLLRNICEAQRTYAHDYLVCGGMLKPPELKVGKVTVDVWASPNTIEMPRILHSAWKGSDGKRGHVLVNWTGGSETGTLQLVMNRKAQAHGDAFIVTAKGRVAVPKNQVEAGRVTVTVPPRSVLLVEQG